jgi:hypothetical protein
VGFPALPLNERYAKQRNFGLENFSLPNPTCPEINISLCSSILKPKGNVSFDKKAGTCFKIMIRWLICITAKAKSRFQGDACFHARHPQNRRIDWIACHNKDTNRVLKKPSMVRIAGRFATPS